MLQWGTVCTLPIYPGALSRALQNFQDNLLWDDGTVKMVYISRCNHSICRKASIWTALVQMSNTRGATAGCFSLEDNCDQRRLCMCFNSVNLLGRACLSETLGSVK